MASNNSFSPIPESPRPSKRAKRSHARRNLPAADEDKEIITALSTRTLQDERKKEYEMDFGKLLGSKPSDSCAEETDLIDKDIYVDGVYGIYDRDVGKSDIWLSPVKVKDGNGGLASGSVVHVRPIRWMFYYYMNQLDDDFALELFDRYGFLKREWQEHCVNKGSAVFGEELGRHDFLLIHEFSLDRKHDSQEDAEGLFEDIWQSAVKENDSIKFAFVCGIDMIEDWRGMGFRRVGLSNWLCWARDSNHASKGLARSDDPDPGQLPQDSEKDESNNIYDILSTAILDDSSDSETVKFFNTVAKSKPPADNDWKTVSLEGCSLLHDAATVSKFRTIRWLLDSAIGSQLKESRNNHGHTPLEVLLHRCEMARTKYFVYRMGDGMVKSIAQLRGIQTLNSEVFEQISCGCTCGACLLGRLSPRTRERLAFQADEFVKERRLVEPLSQTKGRRALEQKRPSSCREPGFQVLVGLIGKSLKDGRVPYTADGLEWVKAGKCDRGSQKVLETYLGAGGTVATAFRYLVELQQEKMFEKDPNVVIPGFKDLQKCQNDDEYEWVRMLCVEPE